MMLAYEPSAQGRAALHHALGLASRAGVPLTVIRVAEKEPVLGCGQCRANTVFWNRERRLFAAEDLAEAARLAGAAPNVDFEVVEGQIPQAIADAAGRVGADLIVLPSKPSTRLPRVGSTRTADRLRRAGRWTVLVAPAR